MGRAVWIAFAALLLATPAAGQGLSDRTSVVDQRRPPTPVVVELYTAQGCAECAAANAWAARIAGRKNLIVLTFPVDYWDYLGWKDSFAHPAFANRQRAYKQKLGWKDVYTPQVVLDGRFAAPAVNARQLMQMIGKAPNVVGPKVTFDRSGERVFVRGGPSPPGGAEVWMVRYDPRTLSVFVTSGENKGAEVRQRNTVRELVRLGPYTGRGRAYALPRAGRPGLRTVVVVQSMRRAGVLAAGRDTDIETSASVLAEEAR